MHVDGNGAAGDFAQLEAIDGNDVVRRACEGMTSQIQLTTVHRSQDEKHLAFVSAIRESQPSRQEIREYFGLPVDRFLGFDRTLEQWLDFGMAQQQLHGHPFLWICNTNRGVAKVSRAALRRLGISM